LHCGLILVLSDLIMRPTIDRYATISCSQLVYEEPVLVANSDSRKRQRVAVGQVSGREDAVLEVLVDVVRQKLESVAEQCEEDDQPVDLPDPGWGQSGIAEAADGRLLAELGKRVPDDYRQPQPQIPIVL